jgi:hypothetical protein
MVWASLLKELLKVDHGRLHLVLAAACDSRDAHHIRATRLLAIGTIAIDRGCGLLKMLLASFTTTLGTLHGVLDGDVERCLPAIAWGQAKLGCHATSGVLGDDTVQLLNGVPDDMGRCLEGLCQRHVTCSASGCLFPWPLGVTTVSPPATGGAVLAA